MAHLQEAHGSAHSKAEDWLEDKIEVCMVEEEEEPYKPYTYTERDSGAVEA